MLPTGLRPAAQILNFCCSLYLIDKGIVDNHLNHSASDSVAFGHEFEPAPASNCRKLLGRSGFAPSTPPLVSAFESESLSVFDLDPGTRGCIPRVSSCCLLQIVDVEFDAFTNQPHFIYGLNPNHSALMGRLGLGIENQKCQATSEDEDDPEPQLEFDPPYVLPPYEEIPWGGPRWILLEPWEIAVKTCATLPVALIAVGGNLAVIRIIFKTRLTKNSVNLFILNMSIADLLNALIFPWIFLVKDFYQRFVLGKVICEYHSTVLNTLMLTSVFSLCTISFDRLAAVVFPFRPKMSPRVAKYMIYCIWIAAAAISAPIVIWRTFEERKWLDFLEIWCNEERKKARLYWLLLISALFWLPISVLVISYTAIIVKLHFLESRQHEDHGRTSQIKAKSKVIWMFFFVLVAFIICWTPFTIVVYERNRLTGTLNTEMVPPWLDNLLFASEYLMIVNSAVNPIIYGFKNENLRRGFRAIIPSCCKRQNKIKVSTIMADAGKRQQQQWPPSSGLSSADPPGVSEDIMNNAVKMNLETGIGRDTRPLQGLGSAGGTQMPSTPPYQFLTKTRKYYENILFANNSGMEKASLNSYERRESALADLGLSTVPETGTVSGSGSSGSTSTSATVSTAIDNV